MKREQRQGENEDSWLDTPPLGLHLSEHENPAQISMGRQNKSIQETTSFVQQWPLGVA